MMYKKMLVPLDTSDFAECVFEHVREIATAREIPEVDLLVVVEPVRLAASAYFGSDKVDEVQEAARKSAEQYLEGIKQKIGLNTADVKVNVITGIPADEILDFVDQNKIDLVVMSSHGRSGMSRWFLGNTVEKVLRSSSAPVFLVPHPSCRRPVD
ncbi:universal stress protein [Candidatus Bipolaricaulota bacterium]|nr:universal stress protein [Candidatus Bipolaricaulota bacterium]